VGSPGASAVGAIVAVGVSATCVIIASLSL
jgi:hypothetical protein